jgi:hypothetical protein
MLVMFATFLVVCLGSSQALPQNPPDNAPKPANIVEYLTETISWYRGTAVEQQIANEPSDVPFLNENRRISAGSRRAFDFARLVERNESTQPKGNQTQEAGLTSFQSQRDPGVAKADQQVEESRNELVASTKMGPP